MYYYNIYYVDPIQQEAGTSQIIQQDEQDGVRKDINASAGTVICYLMLNIHILK